MSTITRGDFSYYKNELFRDKSYHEDEYLNRIEPDRILAYYEGTRKLNNDGLEYDDNDLSRIALNKIFTATNTVASTLYPSNPGFTATAKREQDELNAKVARAAMNYYFEEMNALEENQRAIINAWLFGFGCIKQGWRTVFRKKSSVTVNDNDIKNKVPSVLEKLGISTQPVGDVNVEIDNDEEFVALEEPFIYCVDNSSIIMDRTQPFGKGKRISQHLKRSLYELRCSSNYNLDDDFIKKFSRKKDQRECILDVYEIWLQLPDGIHILTMVDGWDKPIRWDKSPYMAEGFPFTLLRLNLEPGVTYPVSHMKAAQRVHRELDYILSLQLMHIRKHRSIDIFHEQSLDTNAKNVIRNNPIGGYIFSKAPITQGVHAHVGGATIPKDLFNMQSILIQNLEEILTVTGSRISGASEQETATQEKITEFGNQLRTMTMQDQVNGFIRKQGIKLLQDLKQFATSPLLLKVTGLNLTDPMTGQQVTEKWVEFATENNPIALRDAIQSDLDIDIDATNLARRDIGLVRQQMQQILNILALGNGAVLQLMATEGTKFSMTEFFKELMKNFETIGNPEKFFSITPQMAMQGQIGQEQVQPQITPQDIIGAGALTGSMPGGVGGLV